MVRIVSLVLALAACAAGAVNTPANWRGWLDTASITDTLKADEIHYTAGLNITDGEDLRVLVKFDDTASAGYASDSIKFAFGYQLGTITTGSAGARDTLWDDRITLDTADVDSFGVAAVGSVAASGALTRVWNRHADTTDVSGYAVMDRWFVPEWAEIIRYWAAAQSGQRQGKAIKLVFEQHQRRYIPVGR